MRRQLRPEMDDLMAAIQAVPESHYSHACALLAGIHDAAIRVAGLSQRQKQTLALLARGRPNKLVAHELGISARTVEIYRKEVMDKLGVRTLVEAARVHFLSGGDPIEPEPSPENSIAAGSITLHYLRRGSFVTSDSGNTTRLTDTHARILSTLMEKPEVVMLPLEISRRSDCSVKAITGHIFFIRKSLQKIGAAKMVHTSNDGYCFLGRAT